MNAHSIPHRPLSVAERPQQRDPANEGARPLDRAETPPEKAFASLVDAPKSEASPPATHEDEAAGEAPRGEETAKDQASEALAATSEAHAPAATSLMPAFAWLAQGQIQGAIQGPNQGQGEGAGQGDGQGEEQERTLLQNLAPIFSITPRNSGADEASFITNQRTAQGIGQAAQQQGLQPLDQAPAQSAAPDAFQTLLAETEAASMLDILSAPASPSGTALPARIAEALAPLPQPNPPPPSIPIPVMALPAAIGIKALEGSHIFDIRLDPDELGRVDIVLEIDQEGSIRAAIAAEKPEALQLIMREARALEQAFDQAGFRRDENALSFSLADREPSSQHSHHPSEQHGVTRFLTEGEGDLPAPLEALLARANGRLDVRI
jgi:flagellar hook-length control protein FliK